LDTSAVSAA